jgi:hypothetical protein
MATSFIGSACHTNKGLLYAFHDANGLMVFGGWGGEVDAGLFKNRVAEAAGEVGPSIGNDTPRGSVTGENVLGEDVQYLSGGRVLVHGDGFDPTREGVYEDNELRGAGASGGVVVVCTGHVDDVGIQHVEGVVTKRRSYGLARSSGGVGGERAFVALRHMRLDLAAHIRPVISGTEKSEGSRRRPVAGVVMEGGNEWGT